MVFVASGVLKAKTSSGKLGFDDFNHFLFVAMILSITCHEIEIDNLRTNIFCFVRELFELVPFPISSFLSSAHM